MDVQDALPKEAWKGPSGASHDGAARKAAGEDELAANEDNSDGEAEFCRLVQQYTENPSEEIAQRLHENEARLRRKTRQQAKRKRELKAMVGAYRQKEREFMAQMEAHSKEVERVEKELSKRIEALTADNQELREETERKARDSAQNQEKLNEVTKLCSESETRVQFLMERILALLNASSADPEQIARVSESRRQEREVLKQIEETRQQFDEVRQQNGELTSRLTDEMSLSRRLSEQLAEVEDRFFHQRSDRGPQGDAHAQLRAAGLLNSQLRLPDAAPDIPQAEEPLPPSLSERCLPGEPGRRTPLRAVPEAEVPPGLDFDLPGDEDTMDAPHRLAQDVDGMEPIAEDPLLPSSSSPGSDEGSGSRTSIGASSHGREGREEQHLSRASSGSRRLPSTGGLSVPRLTPQGVEIMESKLREALDHASFECPVVRVESGVYQFGQLHAVVKLTAENEVVAARQDGQGAFEPIDDFIRAIAQEGRRPQGAWMDKAGEDQGILGEPLPPPPRTVAPGASAAALAEGFLPVAGVASEPEREPASQAGRASPPWQQPTPPLQVPPLMVPPVRSPRTHWQPQAALAANTSPPRGPATATPPPQRSSSSRPGQQQSQQQSQQQQLGASFRAPRQSPEPTAVGANVQARAGASPAPVVPPLHLHAASSVLPFHARAAASSTPERPRTGLPTPPVGPASTLGAPLVSPRPQTGQQKPAARQLATSPPRVVRGPVTASTAMPPRVTMTQSPRRQFAT